MKLTALSALRGTSSQISAAPIVVETNPIRAMGVSAYSTRPASDCVSLIVFDQPWRPQIEHAFASFSSSPSSSSSSTCHAIYLDLLAQPVCVCNSLARPIRPTQLSTQLQRPPSAPVSFCTYIAHRHSADADRAQRASCTLRRSEFTTSGAIRDLDSSLISVAIKARAQKTKFDH